MTHPFRVLPLPEPPAPPRESAEAAAARIAAETAAAEAMERQQRETLRAAAQAEGHAEGLRRGRAEALAAFEAALPPALARLEALQAELAATLEASVVAMTQSAVDLGQSLAEHLVGAPRPFDRAALLTTLLAEARGAAAEGGLQITCRAATETLEQMTPALAGRAEPLVDDSLAPGGFVIETREGVGGLALGRWDASVERMREILQRVRLDG